MRFSRRGFIRTSVYGAAGICVPDWLSNAIADSEESGDYLPLDTEPNIYIALDDEPVLKLNLHNGTKEYPIVAGKPNYKTPRGEFSIMSKIKNPSWCPNMKRRWVQNTEWFQDYVKEHGTRCIPSGHPRNPLGPWKMMFKAGGYYIHGNGDNAIDDERLYASHGCIRMRDDDIRELANEVDVGTPVLIS